MNVAGYIRVSISEQAEDGFSLESQAHIIQRFIQDKGWTLVETYTDAAISISTRTARHAARRRSASSMPLSARATAFTSGENSSGSIRLKSNMGIGS